MVSHRLTRDERPIPGNVFVATPFGVKTAPDGELFDYDNFFKSELVPLISSLGMTAVRADSLYGGDSVLTPVWKGIQQAEIVLVVFSDESVNVSIEFAWAYLLGKKMIYLTQDLKEIPADVKDLRTITYSSHYAHMNRMREELRLALEAVREETVVEMTLLPMIGGGTVPVPARVVSASREFVVVETDDGRHGVLSNADVDYTRLVTDMTTKYEVGARLQGAFDMDARGDMRYTLLAGSLNPWPVLSADYPVGKLFTGTVHNVHPTLGVFVHVAHGVNGLLAKSDVVSAARLEPGDDVEVTVVRMDTERRRISLRLIKPLRQSRPLAAVPRISPASREAGLSAGDRFDGEVLRTKPEGQGGYVLLKLPGRSRPVILHCTAMSEELRHDLNADAIEPGEMIWVEILSVDLQRDRVLVKELPESVDDQEAAA
ncbi:S1 RNA-binding domain-containing protein [Streptomyces sp. AC555_RSS877]|uniref:S1 RNA-binding domain-containing protein n=1 Tax=Streptomyces sp. AC555_RSS877 TaxID=2823688 RepID=UPI001C27FE7C|nr:S1 RNA-binding domain-containing protein [Streptomyces sp. AC555_RSS877]